MAQKTTVQKLKNLCLFLLSSTTLSGVALLAYQICVLSKHGRWKTFGSSLVLGKILSSNSLQELYNHDLWLGLNKIIFLVYNFSLALFLIVFGLIFIRFITKNLDSSPTIEQNEQLIMKNWRCL